MMLASGRLLHCVYPVKRLRKAARRGCQRSSRLRPRLGVDGLEARCLLSANPTITEYPLPTPGTSPEGIVAGSDGNLWFTEQNGENGGIGRISPTGQVTEFHTGISPGGAPVEITAGRDGNLWFTEESGAIGRITPDGTVTEFRTGLTPDSEPHGITAGPDGNLWFTEFGGAVGRITPAGAITEFHAGLPDNSAPKDITSGPDGNVWFSDVDGSIGRITPAGVITEFPTGLLFNGEHGGITAAPDGNLWFTAQFGQVGRITTLGVVTAFSTGITPGSRLAAIALGPDGNLWFTEGIGDRVGQITPAGTISEFSAGITPGSAPNGITAGPDGNLWFTELSAHQIGRLALPAAVAAATTTTLSTSLPSAVSGQTSVLTALVSSPAGTPSGTVTFFDGVMLLGSAPLDDSGEATLSVSLGVGQHSLSAFYPGNAAFAPSTSSPSVPETVNPAGSAVGLDVSTSLTDNGQPATFTATVTPLTPGAGTPTGAVTFWDGNQNLGSVPLAADGTAVFTARFAHAGAHAINAVYSGDANFTTSTSPAVTETVNPAAATIALGASSDPSIAGELVTFTATVTAALPGIGTPTGTVTFRNGDVVLGTAVIAAGGMASITTRLTAPGSHAITADYSGDGQFGSSSQTVTEQVSVPARKATSMSLVGFPHRARRKHRVEFTATVLGTAATDTPTGTVTFTVGKSVASQVPLDGNGRATWTDRFASRGRFTIRASFSGDGNFAPSAQSLTERVS
jgi:streptogramin lyase